MKNIAELCKAAHAQSVKSGFWLHDEGCEAQGDPVPRGASCHCPNLDLSMKIALIHSEISEALEEYRLSDEQRGGPLGAVLYDMMGAKMSAASIERIQANRMTHEPPLNPKPVGFLIELADVAIRVFDLTGRLELSLTAGYERDARPTSALSGVHFAQMHYIASMTFDAMRMRTNDKELIDTWLTALVNQIEAVAVKVGGDIDEAIRIKMSYNATREFKHGKRC